MYTDVISEIIIDEEIIDIACCVFHHVALSKSGNVYSWGIDVGYTGPSGRKYITPTKLDIANVESVYCGPFNTILMLKNNTVKYFGVPLKKIEK